MGKNEGLLKRVVVAIVIFALMSVAIPVGAGTGQDGTIKWPWKTDSDINICGTPAIGPDGNIYVTGGGGTVTWVPARLFCVSPEGSMLWKSQVQLDHSGASDPVIASDGTIYVVGYYKLYAFNPDGTLKWEWELEPDLHYQIAGLALGTDGTIYTGHCTGYGGCVFAINPDGTLKWGNKYEMYAFKAFTIGKNGDVYMESQHYNGTHVLCALNPDNGAVLWSTELGSYVNQGGMAIGSDGTIYVPLYGTKKLQALNPDGTKKWHYDFPGASGIPSIGSDGTIYAATISNKGLYALTSSGELKWTAGECIAPEVAIASDGTIYFCGSDPASRRIPGHERDNYIAVNPDGSIKWTLAIPAHAGSPAIGSDGTIYVTGGRFPGVLTAVYGSAPLASSPWPRSRHDNRNTGSYGVIPTPTFTPAPTPAPTPTGAPTPSPTPTPIASTLTWNGMDKDKVSRGNGPNPDGDPDGHFSLTLTPKDAKTVNKITLLSTDKSGNPVGGQVWNTVPDGYWILGVEQPSGNRLNPTDKSISKTITTTTTFELYGANSGWFKEGQHFKAVVEFTDGTSSEAITTVSKTTTPTPTPSPTPGKICEGDEPYLYVEDRVMGKGKTVEIPIMMCNAEDLANMDIDWSYNAAVLKIIDVTKGSLNKKALFEWNEVSAGKLKISFASSKGVTGSMNSIAVMKFEVIGNPGATSTLTGTVTTASKTDGSKITVGVNPGKFTVGSSPVKGDCDGDGKLTVKDALAALQISVGKMALDMCYDYNGDGKVNSADARDMLKAIVGKK